MKAWGFALTSGNWITWLSKMHNHHLKLMRPWTACRGPSGSPHSTWNMGIGRSRWLGEQTIDCFHSRAIGILQMWKNALWVDQCPCHVSAVDRDLPQGSQHELVHYLPRWHRHPGGAGSHPQRTSEFHQSVQLQPAHFGPSGGQPTGHLHDQWRLVTGPTVSPCPE